MVYMLLRSFQKFNHIASVDRGKASAEKGDFADAESKIKIAKTSFWIGLGLGILFVVAYIAIFALGIAAGITEEILYY